MDVQDEVEQQTRPNIPRTGSACMNELRTRHVIEDGGNQTNFNIRHCQNRQGKAIFFLVPASLVEETDCTPCIQDVDRMHSRRKHQLDPAIMQGFGLHFSILTKVDSNIHHYIPVFSAVKATSVSRISVSHAPFLN
jgi:hypothetical protein